MIRTLTLEPMSASNSAFWVDEADVLALGGGRRPKVVVTVEGVTWRTSIAPMGGHFCLGLTKAQYAQTGVQAGQSYEIEFVLDTEERMVEIPEDLEAVLSGDADLRAAWDRLSYTHRKEHALALTSAKKDETRNRRLQAIIAALSVR